MATYTLEKDKMQELDGFIIPKDTTYNHRTIPTTWIGIDGFRPKNIPTKSNETVWNVAKMVRAYHDIKDSLTIDLSKADFQTYTLLDGNIIAHYDGQGVKFDTYNPLKHKYQLAISTRDISAKYTAKRQYERAWDSIPKATRSKINPLDFDRAFTTYLASGEYPARFYHGGMGLVKSEKAKRSARLKAKRNLPTAQSKTGQPLTGCQVPPTA